MISTLSELMGNSLKTVSNWKKEKRPIMNFLYKYFTKEDLQEFLETGKISKLERNLSLQLINKEAVKIYIDFIQKLNFEEIVFFLSIIFEIKQNSENTSDVFLDYLLLSNCDISIKKQTIISINSISNQVLFFYAVDYLSDIKFKDIYYLQNNNNIFEKNHLLAYIQSFLNLKKGIDYPDEEDFFEDKKFVESYTVYPEGEYWDLEDVKSAENKAYKNYLYSLIFGK